MAIHDVYTNTEAEIISHFVLMARNYNAASFRRNRHPVLKANDKFQRDKYMRWARALKRLVRQCNASEKPFMVG